MAGTEQTKIEVLLDGRQASDQLKDLSKNAAALRMEMAKAYEANDAGKVAETEWQLSKLDTRMKQLRKQTFDVKEVLNNLSGATMSDLRQAIVAVDARLNDKNIKRNSDTWNQLTEAKRTLIAEQKKLRKEMGATDNAIRKQRLSVADWVVSLGVVQRAFNGVKNFLRESLYSFNAFQKGVKGLSSLTGLTGNDLNYLSDQAKELSTSTLEGGIIIQQSATEIVDSYKMIGSQRPELLKNKEALNQVTQEAIILSEAAEMELQPASKALTNSLNQFNASADQSRRFINVLAAGSQAGAGNINYLSQAIEKSGTTANLMGLQFEQLVALIETAAPKFSEAAVAGNSIDKVLLKMRTNQIGFRDGVFDVNAALDELAGRIAKGERVVDIFGEDHAKMVEVLVQGREEFSRYQEAVTGTNKAIEQAATNTDTNDARLRQQKNRLEQLRIELGEKLTPLIGAFTSGTASLVKVLISAIGFFTKYGTAIAWVTAAITAQTVVMKYKISLHSLSEKLISRAILLNKAETGSINTLTAAKLLLTSGIKSATAAVRTFFSALMKNPLGLVLTGITLLGVAIYKVVTHMSAAEKVTQRLNEIQKEYRRNLMEEKTQMDYLFDALKKSKEGTDERKTAIKLLNDKYGEYLPNLLTEKSTLEEIEKAQKFANDELVRSLTLKAKKSALEDTAKTYMENYEELYNNFIKRISKGKSDEQKQVIESQINDILNWLKSTKIEYNVDTKVLKSTSSEYQALMQKVHEFEKRNGKNGTNTKTWMLELLGTTQKMNKELDRQETYYNNIAKGLKTPGEAAKGEDPDNKENAGNDKAEIAPDYSGKIIALKESYAAQKITKNEYEKQLDDLELAHLEFRLKNYKGEEEKRRELEEKIADKKIAIREKRNKEETAKEKDKSQEYIDVLLAGNDDLSRKEEAAYRDRLKKAGFFGKERKSLTARELAALEVLEKEHQQNLKKIEEDGRKKRQAGYLKEISDEMKRREAENSRELLFMQAGHAEEIAAYQGSRAGLKALKKKQHKEEMELAEKQANEMINLLEGIFYSAQADELLLGEQMLPEEELENLEKKILEIKKKAAEIKSGMNDAGGENDPDNSVDLLGMTAYQWSEFFKNLEDGKFDIEELIATVGALQSAWGTYDKFKTAQEKKELKRYEQKTKKEKAALDRQLDAGKISQEQYTARVSQLDAELDAKKETLERKQAKRKQSMAIIDSIINTAVGVTAALSTQPIWLGIALAAVVGAMGAAETAIIAAQQYAKGKYPVIGGDDGLTYEADYVGDDLQTGIYQKPTLGLFSEKEPEMVVDGATTRKLVFDYPRIYESIMDVASGRIPQYQSGKYPPVNASVSSDPEVAYFSDPEIKSLLRKNIEMLEGLKNMEVVISMYGRNGLQKALKKMNDFERKTTYK